MDKFYLNRNTINRLDISPSNPSFLYGINVFEGIRAYWNPEKQKCIPFKLKEHLERLEHSMLKIGFTSYKSKSIEEYIEKIIEKENIKADIYIRITIYLTDDNRSWYSSGGLNELIEIRACKSYLNNPKSFKLVTTKYHRINEETLPPDIKAGANYLNSRYGHIAAINKGADGVLFKTIDGKYISESSGSCIFFISNEEVVTPSLDSGILNSITRKEVISILKENGVTINERKISYNEIRIFSSAFLAGTMMEIKPISEIDDVKFNDSNQLIFRIIKDYKKRIGH